MRIESIILELKRRIAEHEKIANEAFFASIHNGHMAVARALRGVIPLIESYKTDNDSPTDKET